MTSRPSRQTGLCRSPYDVSWFTDHILPAGLGTCRVSRSLRAYLLESQAAYHVRGGRSHAQTLPLTSCRLPQQGSSSAGGRQLLTDPLQMTGRMHTVQRPGGAVGGAVERRLSLLSSFLSYDDRTGKLSRTGRSSLGGRSGEGSGEAQGVRARGSPGGLWARRGGGAMAQWWTTTRPCGRQHGSPMPDSHGPTTGRHPMASDIRYAIIGRRETSPRAAIGPDERPGLGTWPGNAGLWWWIRLEGPRLGQAGGLKARECQKREGYTREVPGKRSCEGRSVRYLGIVSCQHWSAGAPATGSV